MRRLAALVLLMLSLPAAAQDVGAAPRGFFAEQGDVALTAGVFGVGGGGISHVGVRYWATDRTALGLDVGEATLDVGGSEDLDGLFPSYLTATHTQSLSLWAERHIDTPASAASLVLGARAYAGLQSRKASQYGMYLNCRTEPCVFAGVESSAREEAVTGGLAVIYGGELRVFRGLTVGATWEYGLARTSAELRQWTNRGTAPPDSRRADWHGVRDARLSVSVYL